MAIFLDRSLSQYIIGSDPLVKNSTTDLPCTMSCRFYHVGQINTGHLLSCGNSQALVIGVVLSAYNDQSVKLLSQDFGTPQTVTSSQNLWKNETWHQSAAELISIFPNARSLYVDGTHHTTVTGASAPVNLDSFGIGSFANGNPASNTFSGYIADVGVWDTVLEDWEHELLGNGLSAKYIRPESLTTYASLTNSINDEINGNMNLQFVSDDSSDPIFAPDPPNLFTPVQALYAVEQHNLGSKNVDTSLLDFRVTRLKCHFASDSSTSVQWEISIEGGDIFRFTTDNNGLTSLSANVFDSDKTTLDLWLPPHHNFIARVRQMIDGNWTYWSEWTQLKTMGYINSFQKYQILSRGVTGSGVIVQGT